MTILPQLIENKGTVSSALGKELALKALQGKTEILYEAIELLKHHLKNVRAGAAKIIEEVAEKQPELVAPHLSDLTPALEMPEPQTRWMIIHTIGMCAKWNANVARQVFDSAASFLPKKNGTCLQDSAIRYFGYIGALTESDSKRVFPVLEEAIHTVPERIPRILESFSIMIEKMDQHDTKKLNEYLESFQNHSKPVIKNWTKKLLKRINQKP